MLPLNAGRGQFMNITAEIGRRSCLFIWFCTLGLMALAVTARFLIPPRFSMAFIFLLPISFASWFITWRAASAIALAGALFLLYFDLRFTNAGAAGACWNGFIDLTVAGTFIYIFAELRALYLQQLHLSRRDPLTGLLNRRAFMEMVGIETNRMARHRRPVTLAYVDVDNFKTINDSYGHAAGDEFLQGLGRQMSRRLRATDCLARVGGDEFAMLLPETDLAAARLVLNEIHEALRHYCGGCGTNATVSIGAVTFDSAIKPEQMVAMADKAMYAIKRKGKDRVEYRLAS
jgi:diguanylate cyclase (GGDEF)-like protein